MEPGRLTRNKLMHAFVNMYEDSIKYLLYAVAAATHMGLHVAKYSGLGAFEHGKRGAGKS